MTAPVLDAEHVLDELKNDDVFKDCIVSVGRHQFRAHRAVLATVSDVFRNELSSPYANGTIEIAETSPGAVAALIDFAYCLDIMERLEADAQLAYCVFDLACRYNVFKLRAVSSTEAVRAVTVEKSVFFLNSFKQSGEDCEDAKDEVIEYIAKRLRKVVRRCPNFEDLDPEDLEDILSSRELIASEMEKFDAVDKWVRLSGNNLEFHSLLSYVHFEILTEREKDYIVSHSEHIPQNKMSELLEMCTDHGAIIPDTWFRKSGRSSRSWKSFSSRGKPRAPEGTVVLLNYPGVHAKASGVFPKNSPKYHFKVNNWILSAHFEGYSAPSKLVLNVLHRERADYLRSSIYDEIYDAKIEIRARLVGEKECITGARLLFVENTRKGREFRVNLLNGVRNSWLTKIRSVLLKFDLLQNFDYS